MEILKHPAFVQAGQEFFRPFQPQHMAGMVQFAGLLLDVPKHGQRLVKQFYRPHILKSFGVSLDAPAFHRRGRDADFRLRDFVNPLRLERTPVNPFRATGFFQSRVDVLFP